MRIIFVVINIALPIAFISLMVIVSVVSGKLVNYMQAHHPGIWNKTGTFVSFRFFWHVLFGGPIVDDAKYLELKAKAKQWLTIMLLFVVVSSAFMAIVNPVLFRLARFIEY